MSEFFNNKDYEEYFKKLENSLEKKENPIETPKSEQKRTAKASGGFYKVMRIKKSFLAAAAVIIVASVLLITGIGQPKDKPVEQQPDSSQTADDNPVQESVKTVFTLSEGTVAIDESNDAKGTIVVNLESGEIVAERNMNKRLYPASTTKVMTLLVAYELITDFNDTFTITYELTDPLYLAEASMAGFSNDETVTITDLIYGTILPSGADAAMALAVKLCGNEAAFVEKMNQKVAELGLENTHFANVTGLYDSENYSSAYDMAIILRTAMEQDFCRKVLSTYQYTTTKTPEHPDGILLSSTLFEHMYGTEPETATIKGGKTGYIAESGFCLASFGAANATGNEYIVVTFGNSGSWPAYYGQIDLYKEFAK